MSSYKTLKTDSRSYFKEKGSKFYGYAFPIKTKDEVKSKIEEIQAEHPKARHICTALLIGVGDDAYFLTNDDGEPANSAGAPILGQIRSHEITNVFIAVVRYFGGTKLGIGGLIAAYKQTTSEAITANEIIEVEPEKTVYISVDYTLLGDLLSIIDKNNLSVTLENKNTSAVISLTFEERNETEVLALFQRYDLEIREAK